MSDAPVIRYAVRVLLLDEDDQLLLFRGEQPETRVAFWFPAGGGLEDGEDAHSAAARELAEETGLADLALGPEVWRRRHVFPWRGVLWDQRERWFIARVAHFTPVPSAPTDAELIDLTACRWWTMHELETTTDALVPRDLPTRLRTLLTNGPPSDPIQVGI